MKSSGSLKFVLLVEDGAELAAYKNQSNTAAEGGRASNLWDDYSRYRKIVAEVAALQVALTLQIV